MTPIFTTLKGGSWGDDEAQRRAAAESEDDVSSEYEEYNDDAGDGGGGGGGVGGGDSTTSPIRRQASAQLEMYYNPEDLAAGSMTDIDVYAVAEETSWSVEPFGAVLFSPYRPILPSNQSLKRLRGQSNRSVRCSFFPAVCTPPAIRIYNDAVVEARPHTCLKYLPPGGGCSLTHEHRNLQMLQH
jgi:hypothetical protein